MPKNLQHTAEFIAEMKKVLTNEQKHLEKELSGLASKRQSDFKPNFPDYGRQDEDNAAELTDFQSLAATEVMLEQRYVSVKDALERVEAGKYGITAEGELIPEKRLRANPAATTTVPPRE